MSSHNHQKNNINQHDRLEQEQLQVQKLAERTVLVGCILPDSKLDENDP